jgi:hypothetical protein
MRIAIQICLGVAMALLGAAQAADNTAPASKAQLERGRYLVRVADCNGCHTVGFAESGGRIA